MYRRGRWARGTLLSVGIVESGQPRVRVGLRTKRGFKGAVERNRLKRQLRAILMSAQTLFRPGLDVVVVIHQPRLPVRASHLKSELYTLCKRLGRLG